jgi:outer membrane protein insertion porin family
MHIIVDWPSNAIKVLTSRPLPADEWSHVVATYDGSGKAAGIALYVNGEIGYGHGYAGKPLPFFRNFYAGGPNSVRGFYTANIGPKDANGDPIGGERKLVSNIELMFPFPGMQNDKSVRVSAFVDGGIIGDTYAFSDLRTSAGISVLYVSPFGPLKVSFAQPIKSQEGDKIQKIQFTFGQQF